MLKKLRELQIAIYLLEHQNSLAIVGRYASMYQASVILQLPQCYSVTFIRALPFQRSISQLPFRAVALALPFQSSMFNLPSFAYSKIGPAIIFYTLSANCFKYS
jgi:hypothetical protein